MWPAARRVNIDRQNTGAMTRAGVLYGRLFKSNTFLLQNFTLCPKVHCLKNPSVFSNFEVATSPRRFLVSIRRVTFPAQRH
jgi:hypothetical protein